MSSHSPFAPEYRDLASFGDFMFFFAILIEMQKESLTKSM